MDSKLSPRAKKYLELYNLEHTQDEKARKYDGEFNYNPYKSEVWRKRAAKTHNKRLRLTKQLKDSDKKAINLSIQVDIV